MSEKPLSLFHTELLQSLLHQSQKQVAEIGLDVEKEPEVKELLETLSKLELKALPEMIHRYQYLMERKGPHHLEKVLLDAFDKDAFIKLEMQRYYPRIYRGLPRVYKKDSPSISHIKNEFSHLPSLKKQVLSKPLFSLYSKKKVKGKVTIFTWVIQDGFGDFIAALEVMRLLRARLPDITFQFVCLISKDLVDHITLPENTICIFYEKDCPVSKLTKKAISAMRSSDLVLQIPTFYPFTDALIEKISKIKQNRLMPRFEHVGEYGFLESKWFNPKMDRYSLGLHFLEKGILVRRPLTSKFEDIQNEYLKKWMRKDTPFYLAYLATSVGGFIYFHALLKSLESFDQNIDICVPDLRWFVPFYEKRQKAKGGLFEWDMNIKQFEIHLPEKIHTIEISKTGKTVRLLSPGTITQSDFRVLLALSEDFVAVRGNQSFSEAVSQGKAFFYDGREHAKYFMKDLLALAENRLKDFPQTLECIRGMCQGFVYNLPLQEEEWVDETYFQDLDEMSAIALSIGMSLQEPETVLGYKYFTKILSEEFSATPFLMHLVQRALTLQNHPDIEKKENEIVNRFLFNQISFEQSIIEIKRVLTDEHL